MPDDVYVGNYGNYAGAFGRTPDSQAGVFPPLFPAPVVQPVQPGISYSGGYVDAELRSSTGALKDAINTARSVLGQITGAVSSTVNAVKGFYSSVVLSNTSQSIPKTQFGLPSTETGRYVGSVSYLESMKGAFGFGGSPFMMRGDYQRTMSDDFARRTTLLGGSVGSVATELGAGYLGSKLLGPLISKGLFGTIAGGMLGYTGGGFAASHIMGRINQGLEFDSLIKDVSSRVGVNDGYRETGFNAANRRKITKELRKGDLGLGDYADVMMYGSESGLFNNVSNPDEFVNTVKNAAKQVRALMKILRETDVRDVIKDIAVFKQWGVPMEEQVSFAMHAKSVGRSLGLTAKGAMEIAASGAQAGMQMGFTGEFGAKVGMHGALMGRSLSRVKAVEETEMARYGGSEQFGQMLNWSLMERANTALGKSILSSMMKKGEDGRYVLDEELYERYTNNKIGEDELRRLSAEKLRGDAVLLDKVLNKPDQLLSVVGDERWSKLMTATYRDRTKRVVGRGFSQNESELAASTSIMEDSRGAEWFRGLAKGEQAVEDDRVQVSEDSRIEKAREEARSKYGISARFSRLWDKTGGAVFGKINRGIDEYITDPVVGMKETIKDWTDTVWDQKLLGLHITELPKQRLPEGMSVGGLSMESQRRVDERFREIQERAGLSQNKEVSATVYADELKESIKSLGSEKFSWGMGVGEKLIHAGAYENIGSLDVAIESKNKEDVDRLSKQYGLYEDGAKKAEELRVILENATDEQKKELQAIVRKLYGEINKTGVGGPGRALITQQADIPADMASAYGAVGNQKINYASEQRVWDEYQGRFVTGADAEKTGIKTMEALSRTASDFKTKEGGAVLGEQEYSERIKGNMAFSDGSEANVSSGTSGQGWDLRSWWQSLRIVPEKVVREEDIPAPEGGYAFMREGRDGSAAGDYAPVPMGEDEYSKQGFVINDPSLEVPKKRETWKRKRVSRELDMFYLPRPGPFIDKEEAGRLDEHLDFEAWTEKWGGASYGRDSGVAVSGGMLGPWGPRQELPVGITARTTGMGGSVWDRSGLVDSYDWIASIASRDVPKSIAAGDVMRRQNEALGDRAGVPRNIVSADVSNEQTDGWDPKKTEESAKKASRALGGTADSAQNLTKALNGVADKLKMVFGRSANSSNSHY